VLKKCFSNCGPRRFACGIEKNTEKLYQTLCEISSSHGDEYDVQSLNIMYQTLTEKKIHPYVYVLKMPLFVDLQQKVDELVIFITTCPSIIILENI
jgi:hypothetical protein